jgi:prolyl oligopeptidase
MENYALYLTMTSIFLTIPDMLNAQVMTRPNYPETRKDTTVIDDYHGTKVADPYRWLEDDNSDETKAWVKAQNKVTFDYLDKIPFRKTIHDRLKKIWNYEKYGSPFKEGGKYYFYKNDGLQNQAVLYSQEKLNSTPSVILDPNTLSKQGTAALGAISFNKTGDKMAYQIAQAGSDWQTIFVKDLKTNETLKEEIHWVKFSGAQWLGDGFYYSRYPEPQKGDELKGALLNHKIYFHKIGTPQSEDELVMEDPQNPKRNMGMGATEDERYIYIVQSEGTSGNMLMVKDLSMETSTEKNAAKGFVNIGGDSFKNDWNVVENDGDWLIIQTNYKAPRGQVIAVNLNTPDEKDWKILIPEDKMDVLQYATVIGGKLMTSCLHNASSKVKFYDTKGKFLNELALPGIGTVSGFTGKVRDNQAFYSFSSYTRPSTVYELDITTMKSKIFKAPKVDFKSDDYETKQVWYPSKDGTKISMFVTYKKGVKLNGKNPTLLYGYGGFNISQLPQFSISRAALLERGGIYAVANIRGGGEYGEEWHKAGTKERKQNVFDDFIAAAEFLIAKKYTSKDFLAIQGGSNGGLLVGACMTQRPDLFKVCFPAVGVLDMLRYDKFTIGRAWAVDYGLSEDKEGFNYLRKYSPLHNLKKTAYPATLVTTADHDDRVVPAHSFKFTATLQENHNGPKPALIRIETAAGHGAGTPTSKQIEQAADILSFMFYNMGIKL